MDFSLPSFLKAEEKLGRSLQAPQDWFLTKAAEVPTLLEAGLTRHHPDMTAAGVKAICDRLTPEACLEIVEALGTLAFPRFTARFRDHVAQLEAKVKAKADAKASDKAATGAGSSN